MVRRAEKAREGGLRAMQREAAAAALAMVVVGVGYQSHLNRNRAEMAASLHAVATIAEMAPGLLSDFEAIEAIDQADPIDEELWAALK